MATKQRIALINLEKRRPIAKMSVMVDC